MPVLKPRKRVKFDVKNPEHLEIARNFFMTQSWGETGCPFKDEFPYPSVPHLIRFQIVNEFFGITTEVDQKTRIM